MNSESTERRGCLIPALPFSWGMVSTHFPLKSELNKNSSGYSLEEHSMGKGRDFIESQLPLCPSCVALGK